jgi:hypothetical protein
MKLLATFEMLIDHNSFDVIDPEVGGPPSDLYFEDWYSVVAGYANFCTCVNCSHALIEVWLADEIQVREDTRWAVVIPFAVGKSGVKIDSLAPEPFQVAVPEGHYALLYELKLRDKDKAYYESMWAEVDRRDPNNSQDAFCRLTFIPKEEEVEARELMVIHWSLRGLKSEAEEMELMRMHWSLRELKSETEDVE